MNVKVCTWGRYNFLTAMQCRFPFLEKNAFVSGTELGGIFMYSNLIVREKKVKWCMAW